MTVNNTELTKDIENLGTVIQIQQRQQDYILVKNSEGIFKLCLADIVYCESYNSSVTFNLKNGQSVFTSVFSLKKCEEMLPLEAGFFRVHSKYLINLFMVKAYTSGKEGGAIEFMTSKNKVCIARKRKEAFLKAFYKFSINNND